MEWPVLQVHLLLMLLISSVDSWLVPQPKENVWVILAKFLQQDSLCMKTNAVEDPMSMCLVGIP